MRRMGISWIVAVVLTWSGAAAQPAIERRTMLQEADAIWRAHGVAIVAVAPEQELRPPTPTSDSTSGSTLASPGRHGAAAPLRREAPWRDPISITTTCRRRR
jgi:hypothetical protein